MPIWIVCYHGVVEQRRDPFLERNFTLLNDFLADVAYFKQLDVLSLRALEEMLTAPDTARSDHKRVVITFDDAHANNRLAQEVLAAAGLPWAVFAPTGAIGGMFWTTELALLMLHGAGDQVALLGRNWPLDGPESRWDAYNAVRQVLKLLPAPERRARLDSLRAQCPPAKELLDRFPSMKMLDWDGVRALDAAGVTIGSHGVDHEIHHASQPPVIRERELRISKQALETALGRECRYFALPNGNWTSHTATEIASAGYRLGFTMQKRPVAPDDDPCLLPRVSPETFRRWGAG